MMVTLRNGDHVTLQWANISTIAINEFLGQLEIKDSSLLPLIAIPYGLQDYDQLERLLLRKYNERTGRKLFHIGAADGSLGSGATGIAMMLVFSTPLLALLQASEWGAATAPSVFVAGGYWLWDSQLRNLEIGVGQIILRYQSYQRTIPLDTISDVSIRYHEKVLDRSNGIWIDIEPAIKVRLTNGALVQLNERLREGNELFYVELRAAISKYNNEHQGLT